MPEAINQIVNIGLRNIDTHWFNRYCFHFSLLASGAAHPMVAHVALGVRFTWPSRIILPSLQRRPSGLHDAYIFDLLGGASDRRGKIIRFSRTFVYFRRVFLIMQYLLFVN
jgi:hypothetical protein